jgi:hypothetical protein
MLHGAGGRHAPAALPQGKRPSTHCTGGWVGPRPSLDVWPKPRSHRDSIPKFPARSKSLYRLYYPGPNTTIIIINGIRIINITPYVTAESVSSPLRIRGAMCSIFSPKTYDAGCLCLWQQRLQANSGIVGLYQTHIRQIPSKSFIACYVLITLSFDA